MTTPLFTEAELRDLVSRDEGQFLGFKSTWDRSGDIPKQIKRRSVRDAIAETVAAFANADGGLLLVGVEDDGSPTGHSYPENVIEDFVSVPRRRLKPSVSCRADRLGIAGVEVLAFNVPIAPEAVMVTGNGFPYRVGDHVTREPQEIINERKQAYRRVGYEQRFRADATLDDLDLELAQGFLARTPVGRRPVLEALRYYGLIVHATRDWRVTNAALLLFAKAPALQWHPRAGLRLFRVAGTNREHGRQRNVTQVGRADPPLARTIDAAHRLAGQQIRRSERLNGLYFEETPEYPDFAWQETIVNAFAHRDYEYQGREVETWFYEDRMEVSSPGELVPPVTLALLQERRPAHATRYPLIVRVLADAGIMRDEGEGIARIFDEIEESLLRAPEVEMDDGVFTVRLFNEPFAKGLDAASGAAERPDPRLAVRMSGRLSLVGLGSGTPEFVNTRLAGLREHFLRHPSLNNADYRRIFKISRYSAARELRRLVENGFLRMEGKGRGAHYLPPAGPGRYPETCEMSPETCAQYRFGASRGPFPWCLRASRLAGESLKVCT